MVMAGHGWRRISSILPRKVPLELEGRPDGSWDLDLWMGPPQTCSQTPSLEKPNNAGCVGPAKDSLVAQNNPT